MKNQENERITAVQADALLQSWRRNHNTPEKVAAEHRKVLLERVSQSMAFDGQSVSIERLRALTSFKEEQP